MKHLQSFENIDDYIDDEPEIGDYVVCTDVDEDDLELIEFITNNIGEVVKIEDVQYKKEFVNMYVVRYDNIPKEVMRRNFNWHETDYNILTDRRGFYPDEILYHSKNKEDALTFIEASKYNI